MTIPRYDQTVHMMKWRDVVGVLWTIRRERTAADLNLYAIEDLRRLYQDTDSDRYPIRLRDGLVDRVQLVSVIWWRLLWQKAGYVLLLVLSAVAAVASVIAAAEGWH